MDVRFYCCQCTSHALSVRLNEVDFGDGEPPVLFPDIELTVWQNPSSGIYTIWERLRDIWHIIRYGHLYGDFVILSKEDAIQLRDHLTEMIDELEMRYGS